MSIVDPGDMVVTSAADLTKTPMRRDVLAQALLNCNFAWAAYAPPLLSVLVTGDPTEANQRRLEIPIRPSADGLIYDFRLILMPSANTTFTIGLEYCTTYAGAGTGWTVLFNDTGVAATAATLLDYSNSATIPATAVALRISVSRLTGTYEWHSVFLRPSFAGNAAPATLQPSGFLSYDDALLNSTGAPINTEMINRVRNNAKALLLDRWQCAMAFAQPTAARRLIIGQAEVQLPRCRIHLPHQAGIAILQVYAIGTVNTGSTADLIAVRVVGGETVEMDANETIQTATLAAKIQGFGLSAYVDLDVLVRAPTNTTTLRSMVIYWQPG